MKRGNFLKGLGVGAAAVTAVATGVKASGKPRLRKNWQFRTYCVNDQCEMFNVAKDFTPQIHDGIVTGARLLCEVCGWDMPVIGARDSAL
jgi:hypothetical protein